MARKSRQRNRKRRSKGQDAVAKTASSRATLIDTPVSDAAETAKAVAENTVAAEEVVATTIEEITEAIDECIDTTIASDESESPESEAPSESIDESQCELTDDLSEDATLEAGAETTDCTSEAEEEAVDAETLELEAACQLEAESISVDFEATPQQLSEIISTNTAVLQQVVQHISELRGQTDLAQGGQQPVTFAENDDARCDSDLITELQQLSSEIETLNERLDESRAENQRLQSDLDEANQLCEERQSSAQATLPTASNADQMLTWEQRKELMFKQMEEDEFDAEAFVETIQSSTTSQVALECVELSPRDYVTQLNEELDRVSDELSARAAEIESMRDQIANQPTDHTVEMEPGTAIEDLVDVDSLIRDEREQLHAKQREWEERFRDTEIATSLERAKLSRERRELARQNEELQEQLIHIRRETELDRKSGGKGSRRWLSILGLGDE